MHPWYSHIKTPCNDLAIGAYLDILPFLLYLMLCGGPQPTIEPRNYVNLERGDP